MSPARQIAFEVLRKVRAGGHASNLLLKDAAALTTRDAGLATEIVFAFLRRPAQPDPLIALPASSRMDPEIRTALRVVTYQLCYRNRTASRADFRDLVHSARR